MDHNFPADERLSLANEGAEDAHKIQDVACINELSPLLSTSDSTTTLIPNSPTISTIENDADPEAQLPSTPPSEEEEPSPPMTWRETGYVAFIILSIFGSAIVPSYLETSGLDPLYFTKLAWYCVVVCMLVMSAFIAAFIFLAAQQKEISLKPSGQYIRFALFKLALMYWGAWLAFYGYIWLWAVLKYPGSKQSVLQISRVWREFQGKMEVEGALTLLTSCLRQVEGNATVSDFGVCLRGMGVKDS